MAEIKKKSNEPRDYKERFEFVLTTNGNIICQRYFKINNFNPMSLNSYELTRACRNAAAIIDADLKDKTNTYLSIMAPQVFETNEQMDEFFKSERNKNRMQLGEGIIVKQNTKTDYFWGGDAPKELGYKFDDGEFTNGVTEDKMTRYVFTFKVDGRNCCTVAWDGIYPKFVRERIDLSNKRGKFNGFDITSLNFEQFLLYKMVQNKQDLVYGIIKNICLACSMDDTNDYTIDDDTIMEDWKHNSNEISFNCAK